MPRLWTKPLRELTPETSIGFDVIDFAKLIGRPFDPYQEWLAIHTGELLPDGSLRFRFLLILIARQNGKTEFLSIMAAYWLWVEQVRVILGTSTKEATAKLAWERTVELGERSAHLSPLIGKNAVRTAHGTVGLSLLNGSRYVIAATTGKSARGLVVDRLIVDELREHRTYAAWDGLKPTTSSRAGSQIWCLSNAGDDTSNVLNDMRASALAFINDGHGDDDLGLFEWSAEDNADPLDTNALRQANPNVGRHGKLLKHIVADAKRAVILGGEALGGFKTEVMCIRVRALDAAISAEDWLKCTVDDVRVPRDATDLVLFLDVSRDEQHASLVLTHVQQDGRVVAGLAKAWSGRQEMSRLTIEVPAMFTALEGRVRGFGFIPNGPAAKFSPEFKDRKGIYNWPPPGVDVVEVREEIHAMCMAFAKEVEGASVIHNGKSELLNMHVTSAGKLWSGDKWRFDRKGEGHCDGAYAIAGAVHLARTLPVPLDWTGIGLPGKSRG